MLRVFFRLPWPVMALIAAALFWLAQDSRERVARFEAEKAEALLRDAPEPVPLEAFTPGDVGLADEVHVTAWINLDHNYELTKERKGTDTVRRMFVLFGPGDRADSTVARGVVVLHPGEVDAFVDLLAAHLTDPADPRMPFNLNGAREGSPDLSDMVDEALAERGLTKDEDFLAVAPYLKGRAVALAPDAGAPERVATVFTVLGALAGLLALGKLAARRRSQAGRAVAPVAPVAAQASLPAQGPEPVATAPSPGLGYGTLATPATGVWSPLEAVKAKQMAAEVSGGRPGAVPGTAETAGGRRKGLGRSARTLRNMSLAGVLYAAIYLAFGTSGGPFSVQTVMSGLSVPSLASGQMAEAAEPQATRVATGAPVVAEAGPAGGSALALPGLPQMGWAFELPAGLSFDWTGDLRAAVALALGGVGLLLLVAAGGILRARRRPAVDLADPWDRLGERLR